MKSPDREQPQRRTHIGKRPWSPPVKGQPVGPEATTQEIYGDEAPVVYGGSLLSRPLKPEEKLKRKGWSGASLVNPVRDLGPDVEVDEEQPKVQALEGPKREKEPDFDVVRRRREAKRIRNERRRLTEKPWH